MTERVGARSIASAALAATTWGLLSSSVAVANEPQNTADHATVSETFSFVDPLDDMLDVLDLMMACFDLMESEDTSSLSKLFVVRPAEKLCANCNEMISEVAMREDPRVTAILIYGRNHGRFEVRCTSNMLGPYPASLFPTSEQVEALLSHKLGHLDDRGDLNIVIRQNAGIEAAVNCHAKSTPFSFTIYEFDGRQKEDEKPPAYLEFRSWPWWQEEFCKEGIH